ncbi:MAG: hypothetical protein H0U49_08095 [Parachlamydiaceae bacterium]|nr:hypothetical protein [Parachlamydiaceae bacterium]
MSETSNMSKKVDNLLPSPKLATSKKADQKADLIDSYIKPGNFHFFQKNPPHYKGSQAILGLYYNVLYPEELQIEEQNILSAWVRNSEEAFPFTDKQFSRTAPFFLGRTSITVLEGLFAEQVMDNIQKGRTLNDAFDLALNHLKNFVIPKYTRKAEIVWERMQNEDRPLIKERYGILHHALTSCYQDPEKELAHCKKNYFDHQDQKSLFLLLEAAIQRGKKLNLPESNRWDHRIVSLKQSIQKVTELAPNSPYFLALQEVTPKSLEDLKSAFPNLNWISYNTTTGEETRNSGEEKILGEFLSFTATLALSPELQVVRVEHESLPSVSGSLRRILGVEVVHKKDQHHFAIFTIHTDYLVQENLYERNVESTSQFVQKFIADDNLPFVCGGDLNAFVGDGGNEYIQDLKKHGPFIGCKDYRDGPFYCSSSIAYSTFLGHVLDSFKALLEEKDGIISVEPNALDHIFLKGLKIIFSTREAGVYDEEGNVVDPYLMSELFNRRLSERKTASDHFLNAVLFTL